MIAVAGLSHLPLVRPYINHRAYRVGIRADKIEFQPVRRGATTVRVHVVASSVEVVAIPNDRVHPTVAIEVGGHDRTRCFRKRRRKHRCAGVAEVPLPVVEQHDVAVLAFLTLGATGQDVEVAVVIEIGRGARAAIVEIGARRERHGAGVAICGDLVRGHGPVARALARVAVKDDELGMQVAVKVADKHLADWQVRGVALSCWICRFNHLPDANGHRVSRQIEHVVGDENVWCSWAGRRQLSHTHMRIGDDLIGISDLGP